MAKDFWLGTPNQDKHGVSSEKLGNLVKSPVVSAVIDVTATGATNAIYIPAGSIVTKVGVLAKVAIAGGSGDIDVGDSTTADYYIDGLTALGTNEIAWGGETGTNAADPHGGKYYPTASYIVVTVTATPAAGSPYIIAYFDTDDSGVISW